MRAAEKDVESLGNLEYGDCLWWTQTTKNAGTCEIDVYMPVVRRSVQASSSKAGNRTARTASRLMLVRCDHELRLCGVRLE